MAMPGARRRPFRITVRLSGVEHAGLRTAAMRAALTLSAFVRFVLTRAKPPRAARRPPVEKVLLARILGRLGEIGASLRELIAEVQAAADRSNPVFLVERDLSRTLAELAAAQRELMAALGRRERRA